MLRVTLFLLAAALAGCASTPEESAVVVLPELSHLVAACNGAFRDGSARIVAINGGVDPCDRLVLGRGLDHVRSTSSESYQYYRADMTSCVVLVTISGFGVPTFYCDPSAPGELVGFGQTHVWR
jgi:hypothetical protein